MKINELISKVRSSQRWIADDDMMSDRLLFSMIITKASLLIKREINARKLLNSDNVFTPYECLNLKLTDLNKCGIDCSGRARRSVNKLPKLQEGIYNYTIQGVYNIDNSREIYPTTIREFINRSKLRYKPKDIYYIIKDGYLYILDLDVESVNIYLYTNDLIENDCRSAFEHEFKFPGYLEDSLFEMVAASLINYHRYPKDVTDNNLEENQ